ncbi:transposase, partial [Aerococcus urinaeequi]|uniref:transposase n=1 Tax=Aerococcus urinaeequi TaxID=51665 RepID=UPI003EC69EA6
KHAASSIVKTLKGKSARLWFKAYPETKAMLWGGHLWTPSYFMATVVHQYINTSIHQYINTSIHQYINTSIHQYINTSIHQYINTSIHQYI